MGDQFSVWRLLVSLSFVFPCWKFVSLTNPLHLPTMDNFADDLAFTLSLTDWEHTIHRVSKDDVDNFFASITYILEGCVISLRTFNKEAFKCTMTEYLKGKYDVDLSELNFGLFLI